MESCKRVFFFFKAWHWSDGWYLKPVCSCVSIHLLLWGELFKTSEILEIASFHIYFEQAPPTWRNIKETKAKSHKSCIISPLYCRIQQGLPGTKQWEEAAWAIPTLTTCLTFSQCHLRVCFSHSFYASFVQNWNSTVQTLIPQEQIKQNILQEILESGPRPPWPLKRGNN